MTHPSGRSPGAPHAEATATTKTAADQDAASKPMVAPTVLSGQWTKRREATSRSLPLQCGCRDPWTCRCTDGALSNYEVDGGRDAALHILATGYTPVLAPDVRRALWRRGGDDQLLVRRLGRLGGGMAA